MINTFFNGVMKATRLGTVQWVIVLE